MFVGCGPGAADLLTVRAVRALQAADVVIWNADLLDRETLSDHTREGAEIIQWPPATSSDIEGAYDRARTQDLLVVRLKGGDPTLFGVLEPELSAVRVRGIACEVIPGISALSAGFAALGHEMATAATGLLLVDAGGFGEGEPARTSIAAYNAGRKPRALQRALLARGLALSTPCTVAIEVARRDEMLISCVLEDLGETIEDIGAGALTMVFAGASWPPRALLREPRRLFDLD